ncbi:MAG TPA: hypothetical protein VH370_15400 [Humisphaera sp.]|jgi:hypothetical protein|nr:hypothetical protein [Humisphaera sp.]
MKQISSLIWKELHEARWFLAVALFLFFIMPVLGWVEGTVLYHHVSFYFDASPWVSVAGSGLAILVAVGSVCRDMNGKLEEFWRSRAVNAGQWLIVKYLVGLAVILVACVPPLIIEIRTNRSVMISDTRTMVTWYPFLWIALYSLSFAAACMVRRVAHATMLALAALLLVYFLPIVIPFLQYLSIDWVLDRSHDLRQQTNHLATQLPWNVYVEPRQLLFVGGMLAISLVALIVSVAIVRRDWRVESSAKLLYASCGAAGLILFSSAAFRLASNLPILQQVNLSPQEHVVDIRVEGTHGLLFTSQEERWWDAATAVHVLNLTPAGIEVGPTITVRQNGKGAFYGNHVAWSGANPNILYIVATRSIDRRVYAAELKTFMVDGSTSPPPVPLWQHTDGASGRPFIFDGRLYILDNSDAEVAVLDLSSPAQPRLTSINPTHWPRDPHSSNGIEIWRSLPQIAELSPLQRLKVSTPWQIEGDLMVLSNYGDGLLMYRLDQLTDQEAHFRQIGQYKPAFLEHIFGADSYSPHIAGGLVYASSSLRAGGPEMRFSAPRVNVFDIHDPTRLKEVGHFAIPAKAGLAVQPLPDGRALIGGGNKLYVVGKPSIKD